MCQIKIYTVSNTPIRANMPIFDNIIIHISYNLDESMVSKFRCIVKRFVLIKTASYQYQDFNLNVTRKNFQKILITSKKMFCFNNVKGGYVSKSKMIFF